MSSTTADLKLLFLSEDEALALLDLCLMSNAENDPSKEQVLLKLTNLVREYMTPDAELSVPARPDTGNLHAGDPEESRLALRTQTRLASLAARSADSTTETRPTARTRIISNGRVIIPLGRRRDWRNERPRRASKNRSHAEAAARLKP